MADRWEYGQTITRREILGYEPTGTMDRSLPWLGKSWLDMSPRVVRDEPGELVFYIPSGSPLIYPPGDWPAPSGDHPWLPNPAWQGNGVLMVHRPGDHHAVWHFWDGPGRKFSHWYINMQTAFRRDGDVFDTQDLELDFVVRPDRSWDIKDWDAVQDCVDQGRFSPELAAWIYEHGQTLIDRLGADDFWWDLGWTDWAPPAGWDPPSDA